VSATTAAEGTGDAGRVARFRETNALLGMTIFIASWAMLFAALFFSYGLIRARALEWPPADLPELPLGLPALATAILAASSWALQAGLGRARRRARGVAGLVFAVAGLGGVFLALQLSVWRDLWEVGLRLDTGTYASVFYGLTVFHALHVAVGLVALAGLGIGLGRKSAGIVPLRLWTLYWHMVGVIWGVMFTLVYLV
jgi:heme/copper-type cytochrome/quinol oxidase subunit 3